MAKHKTEDYKLSAVNYYIKKKVSMDKVCEIFDCKKQSLSRWVVRYEKEKSIKRYSRKEISYKINRPSYLCRNSSGVLDDTSKPKFTRHETGKLC